MRERDTGSGFCLTEDSLSIKTPVTVGIIMSYKSVWDFGRAGKANYGVHSVGEYPTKIRPLVSL